MIEETLRTSQHMTHWSCRTMAKIAGVSKASVQRIWNAHGLRLHRMKTFKMSNNPHFVVKLEDVVGLYISPPEHAVYLALTRKARYRRLIVPSLA